VACCVHGNEHPGYIKEVELMEQLSDYQRVKDAALCSWFSPHSVAVRPHPPPVSIFSPQTTFSNTVKRSRSRSTYNLARRHTGGVEVQLCYFVNLNARFGRVDSATLRPFYSRKRRGSQGTGRWAGPSVSMDGCGK